MNKNKIYLLEDRGIIYVSGKDASDFLQNIISNDIKKVTDSNSCFASLLTPQGKYLFDFILVKHKNGFFLDCEKKIINKLLQQLTLYKLRSNIEILNLSNEFVVGVISKDQFLLFENAQDQEGFTIKFREDPIFLDPRLKDLGARIIINLEKLHLSTKQLNLKVSDSDVYYKLSYELGIQQIDTTDLQDKLFGIECNFEELNGIDFKKGCYVGQENTSRIKLKNKLSKRLFPVKVIEGEIEVDSIFSNDKEIGKILIKDKFPFALIKFKDENFSFDSNFKCGQAIIQIKKPYWLK